MASSKLECSVCQKAFSTRGNLNKHNKKHLDHQLINIRPPTGYSFEKALFKCFEGCEVSFKTSKDLRFHLILEHNFKIEENQLEFSSFEDFQSWLKTEERDNNVRFYKPRGVRKNINGNFEKFVLVCSRSGKQRIVQDHLRKRRKRKRGYSKYSLGCTSHIICRKAIPSNKCSVVYFSMHYGHVEDIQQISKRYMKEVAEDPLRDDSDTCLLECTEADSNNLNCDDVRVRTEVNEPYFINSIDEGCRHNDDATSVFLWVNECRDTSSNPVLLFKKQGELITEWNLNVNDFCLIFMNSEQIEMFKKFGNDIICVDVIYGKNANEFNLTTVLVLDEYGEGFPVAFLISNRKDTYVYEIFFSCIKKAVLSENEYICNTFMSDVTIVYFNAWTAIMGPAQKHLYCSWHIDRDWQQNLSKVVNTEKRKWVYKTLKYLQTCLEEDVFEKDFEVFLSILCNEEGIKNIYDYLINNYYDNRFQWAHCYNRACDIDANMNFASMHRVINHIYLKKKINRLDKSIYALQQYLRDKIINRVIKLPKVVYNQHLHKIKNTHKDGIMNPCNFSIRKEDIFEIDENNGVSYVVRRVTESICCPLVCSYCNICAHTFECSCLDYLVNATICKHIHVASMNVIKSEHIEVQNNELVNDQVVTELVKNTDMESIPENSSYNLVNKIHFELSQLKQKLNSLNYTTENQELIYKELKTLNKLGCIPPLPINDIISELPSARTLLTPDNTTIEKQAFFAKANLEKISMNAKSIEKQVIQETLTRSLYVSKTSKNDHLY